MAGKKVVAWVSRHPTLPAQKEELRRLLGDVEIVQVSGTFASAKEVFEKVRATGASVTVVVLPLSMLAQFLPLCKREGIDVWMAKMEPVHECEGPGVCPEFDERTDVWLPLRGQSTGRHLRFARFERVKEVRVVTEPVEGGLLL